MHLVARDDSMFASLASYVPAPEFTNAPALMTRVRGAASPIKTIAEMRFIQSHFAPYIVADEAVNICQRG
jgi:hypothetical protein